ncbi:SWIM zinc finger family protein [Chlorobium limicola]
MENRHILRIRCNCSWFKLNGLPCLSKEKWLTEGSMLWLRNNTQ